MKKSSLAIAALLTVLSTTQLSVAFADDRNSETAPSTESSAPAPDAPATNDTTAPADGDDTDS